jgi:hypothetical protein
VDVTAGFAVPSAGVYPMRLVAGQTTGPADLEWFTIKTDGTRILMNDTSNLDALRTFRARAVIEPPVFNPPTLAGGMATLSWIGSGTLQETTSLGGSWSTSPSQNNPQSVPATSGNKFYRVQQ